MSSIYLLYTGSSAAPTIIWTRKQMSGERAAQERSGFLITHHWVPNFGANWQALATVEAFARYGVKMRVVDYRPSLIAGIYAERVGPEQRDLHESFLSFHLDLTDPVEDAVEFEAFYSRRAASLWLTGSDAVFRLAPRTDREDLQFPNPYWLSERRQDTDGGALHVALAPSAMGARYSDLPSSTLRAIAERLESFDLVSARDKWTRSQLRMTGYTGTVYDVPDPVFSLGLSLSRPAMPSDPYIVVSSEGRLHSRWVSEFAQICESRSMRVIAIPTPEGSVDDGAHETKHVPFGPTEWRELIEGAAGYIGTRYHAAVVCLRAGVPLVAIDQYHSHALNRGRSKTWLLLKQVGLGGVVVGRRRHARVSPQAAMRMLDAQRWDSEDRIATVDRFGKLFEAYVGRVVNSMN